MARDKGAFRLANPWPRFAWLTCAAIVGIAEVHAMLLDIVIAKQAAVVTTAELADALPGRSS
jgi:hypothetical protein